MTEDDALLMRRKLVWQPLLQFVLPDGLANRNHVVSRVTEGVRELGLSSAEIERIRKAVMQALRKATQREMRDQQDSPVSIRVWISGQAAEAAPQFNPDAQRVGQQKCQGWGFFLVQRQEDDPQAPAGKSHQLIELYLYQEG